MNGATRSAAEGAQRCAPTRRKPMPDALDAPPASSLHHPRPRTITASRCRAIGGGMGKDYRRYSYWLETCGDDLTPRPALNGSVDADVAILGAGYSGLWTAYYLLKREPALKIAIVEREIAGFGASGRNGGWCT